MVVAGEDKMAAEKKSTIFEGTRSIRSIPYTVLLACMCVLVFHVSIGLWIAVHPNRVYRLMRRKQNDDRNKRSRRTTEKRGK